jgi:type IV pilus assembly protein PilN
MIRINLLGTPKPKKGKGRATVGGGTSLPQLEMGGSSILIFALLIIVIAVGGSWWYANGSEAKRTRRDHQEAWRPRRSRIKELSGVKAAYEEKQKQASQLKKRFDVIDQLRAGQAGPVKLLNAMGDTISTTDAVWINTMTEDGNTINLSGVALSPVAVANLMTNLKKSGFFKSVELKETSQEDYRSVPAFTFQLVCEKQVEKKA